MKKLNERQINSLLRHRERVEAQNEKYRARIVRIFGPEDAKKHSQCCPVAGMRIMGASSFTGDMPCACGAGDEPAKEQAR